jgi:AcrR family transcriptional regulator
VKILLASKYLLAYIVVMKNTDKQKQPRKSTEIRQVEIVDAAMKILTTEGSRQFTADRLGAEVGLASGSIFRHFSSMEEILDGVVDRIEEIIFANFPPQADNPLESLRLFFETRVQAIVEHPEVSKLLLTSILIPNGNNSDRKSRLTEFKLRSRHFVIDCLKQAKADGLLSRDISHEESTVLVLGAIYAIGHMAIGATRNRTDRNLTKRIWNLLERSLTNEG